MAQSIFDVKTENSWCPGCGNFGIQSALKAALDAEGLLPHEILLVSANGTLAIIRPARKRSHPFSSCYSYSCVIPCKVFNDAAKREKPNRHPNGVDQGL